MADSQVQLANGTALAPATDHKQPTLYHAPEAERFAMEQRMARLFVESGLFGDIKGQTIQMAIAQAYVKIALGNSMGFSPAESMQGIDIIQGRPAVSAQLRGARMQRNGYMWAVDRLDNKGCKLTIYKGTVRLGEVSFLEEDAKMAGLLGKDNWKKDPSSMFFARAITRAQRRFAPGVLSVDVVSTDEAWDLPAIETQQTLTAPRRASEKQEAQPEPVPAQPTEDQTGELWAEVVIAYGDEAKALQVLNNDGHESWAHVRSADRAAVAMKLIEQAKRA